MEKIMKTVKSLGGCLNNFKQQKANRTHDEMQRNNLKSKFGRYVKTFLSSFYYIFICISFFFIIV